MLRHLTFTSPQRLALFPDEARRRAVVRCLARVDGLLLFSVVDDHLHIVLDDDRPGQSAQRLVLALRPLAAAPLSPAHRRPVDGRSHLRWLVRYLLTQTVKHGLVVHPATWTGSCFLDLVGARCVHPDLPGRLRAQLPRFHMRDAHEIVGVAPNALVAADDAMVRMAGATALVQSASAALAAGPQLSGKAAPVVATRRAVAQLGTASGLPFSELSFALGQPARSVRRLAAQASHADQLQAVRRHLALSRAVASAPPLLTAEAPQAWPGS